MEEQKSDCVCGGIGPELSSILRKLGPSEEVRSHFRNARVEMLKGIRQIIDERIENLSKTGNKGTRVVID
jgi:hypothetical protein